MRIAAVVIAYNPERESLYKNIQRFINYVDTVVLWQNSIEDFDYLNEWHEKIVFMGDGHNEYIARPLNIVIRYCVDNKYDYLLTMDQDSEWTDFSSFIDKVRMQSQIKNEVAIFAPNVNRQFNDDSISYHDIEWVIQSGMLLNVCVAEKLGGFRTDYGIYGIDEEYCFWARKNGYKIRVFTDCNMNQNFGALEKKYLGFYVLNYSPIVRYFLIRNMLWMKREFHDSTTMRRIIHVFLLHSRDIWLGEKNKVEKWLKLMQGVFEGLFKPIKGKRPMICCDCSELIKR